MTARVTLDDLHFAVDWLGSYEGAEDDSNTAAAGRVAAYLLAEARRRERAATEREVARRAGLDLRDPVARRQVRRALNPERTAP